MALLGFDDNYTYYKQMCFKDCAGRYPILIKIIDNASDLVHELFICQIYPRKLDKEDHLRYRMHVDRKSTVSKFDDLTILVDGDSALFPRLKFGRINVN